MNRWRGWACLGVAACATLSFAQSEWARYRVATRDRDAAERLLATDLELFSDNASTGYTDVVVAPGQLPTLWRLGLPFKRLAALPNADAWRYYKAREDDTYQTTYLNLAQINDLYSGWIAANPQTITRTDIGSGWNAANRIYAYRIYSGGAKPPRVNVLIFGGVHAREWIGPSVVEYLTDQLLQGARTRPGYRALLSEVAVHVVPVVNPDGYVYTWTSNRNWRKNRRVINGTTYGVDLNRNFATQWGGDGSSSSPSSSTYMGPSPMSEPEVIAVRDYSQTLPNLVGFIDYHSYGQYVMWPWSYTASLAPDDAFLGSLGTCYEDALDLVGASYTIGPSGATLYLASGVSDDYFYAERGANSLAIEVRDTGAYGFLLPTSQILPTQRENWAGFSAWLFKLVAPKAAEVDGPSSVGTID